MINVTDFTFIFHYSNIALFNKERITVTLVINLSVCLGNNHQKLAEQTI